MWHDSFTCVTWLISICDMTHSHVWHDLLVHVTWLISICDMTMGWLRLVRSIKSWVSFAKEPYKKDCILQKRPIFLRSLLTVATLYLWHESFYIHVCAMMHSYVWHDLFICIRWLIHMCAWHDSFICMLWLIHMCDMTHSYVWHDWHACAPWRIHDVTWLIDMYYMIYLYVRHGSFTRVTWLIHICRYGPWLVHVSTVFHSCSRHDSFVKK